MYKTAAKTFKKLKVIQYFKDIRSVIWTLKERPSFSGSSNY